MTERRKHRAGKATVKAEPTSCRHCVHHTVVLASVLTDMHSSVCSTTSFSAGSITLPSSFNKLLQRKTNASFQPDLTTSLCQGGEAMFTFPSRARLSPSPEAKQTAALLKETKSSTLGPSWQHHPPSRGSPRKPGSKEGVSDGMHKKQEGAKLLYIRPLGEP